MKPTHSSDATIRLDYVSHGRDDPARGVFRTRVADPARADELVIAVRDDAHPERAVFLDPHLRPQIHLAGTVAGLEELGRALIALARLETQDPEPYLSIDDVAHADGGDARLIIRRLAGTHRRPPQG